MKGYYNMVDAVGRGGGKVILNDGEKNQDFWSLAVHRFADGHCSVVLIGMLENVRTVRTGRCKAKKRCMLHSIHERTERNDCNGGGS